MPTAERPDPAGLPADPPLAGLARRLTALLYEALLLVALVFIASFALAPVVSPGSARSGTLVVPSLAGRVTSLLGLAVIGALFYAWTWSGGRRTLPMKTWKLALVTASGTPPTRRQALVRYAAAWIGPALALAAYLALARFGVGALAWPLVFVNWLAAFVDPDRQFLHDRIAGTRLVSTS